uniref:Uncharacterized protein n=1 Tax=Zooxanthella nutricula TaxID=1333877 RepID=A0A7S2KQJ3_9DINO
MQPGPPAPAPSHCCSPKMHLHAPKLALTLAQQPRSLMATTRAPPMNRKTLLMRVARKHSPTLLALMVLHSAMLLALAWKHLLALLLALPTPVPQAAQARARMLAQTLG